MADTLLRSLFTQVLDESQALPGLLRKCLALGAETGSESLRSWARNELNGYHDQEAVPRLVRAITGSTPDVQLAWFLKCADMPATGYAHLALSGWLALVEHTARAHRELGATSREEAVQLCINAFQGITKATL